MNSNQFKKQNIKVIVSETFMVVAVIITVIVLALLVSGYWLNSNFEIERNGMLQISSIPTGASVEIDGKTSSWLERTNSSKILTSGPHTVKLTKDGYDSWAKNIKISEGLLYRLHYPRLFLEERESESVMDVSKYTNASVSSDHNAILLFNDTSEWAYMNLDTNNPTLRKVDISSLFSGINLAEDAKIGLYTGEIIDTHWDYDASHVLIEASNNGVVEWVLLDVNNVSKSINLTKEFGADFSRVEILDNNSNNLIALQNRNLHKIDVSGRSLSAVLIKNVIDFDHYNNEIVFSAQRDVEDISNTASEYYVGHLNLGDHEASVIEEFSSPIKVAVGKFYESKFIAVLDRDTVTVHQMDNYRDDNSTYSISFIPDTIKVGHNGEFIVLRKDYTMATIDFEASLVREWTIEEHFGWLDNDMFYAVSNGELIVYDFDGLNRRVLAHNVSNRFPTTITNDKWLYYFSDNDFMREWLIVR